jgi:hypothetical protein
MHRLLTSVTDLCGQVNLSDAFITGALLVRRVGGEENNDCIKIKTDWWKNMSQNKSEIQQIVFRGGGHINVVYKVDTLAS